MLWIRTWRGSAVTLFAQPLLFLGALGLGLGGLVDRNGEQADGLRYLAFITPGLLVASSMMAVTGSALWGVMAGFKWMGQFRSMVHTAMTPGDVYGGLVVAAAVRSGVAAVVFLAVAAVLGGVPSWWAPLAVVVAMLLAAATVAVLAAFSASRDNDFTFPLVVRLGITPLFLFSDTFFPVAQLPSGLQHVAVVSPLFHAARAARMATTGRIEPELLLHLGVLVAIVAIAAPIGVRTFTKRLTP